MSTSTESRPGTRGGTGESFAVSSSISSGRTLALVGVFLAVTMMLMLPVRSWFSQRSGLAEMQTEIEQAQQRVDGLRQKRSQWEDPAFIEEQARLRLNFVMGGEAGLLTLNEVTKPSVRKTSRPPVTWWGRLWGSVDEMSGRRVAEVGRRSSQIRPDAPR